MTTYTTQAIEELNIELTGILRKRKMLIAGLFPIELQNPLARKYLEQGVLRRISIVARSTTELFSVLPPETDQLPTKETLDLATIQLQASIFNTYGLLDCWAHVWANEFDVLDKKSRLLNFSKIGFGERFSELRGSMTRDLLALVDERKDWYVRLEKLRHSLAHRIPLYIPPSMVDPQNEAEYNRINFDWYNTLDPARRHVLQEKMNELSHFKALMVYDLNEDLPVFFHAQVIVNFLTVEELSNKFALEIKKLRNHISTGSKL